MGRMWNGSAVVSELRDSRVVVLLGMQEPGGRQAKREMEVEAGLLNQPEDDIL